VRGFVANTDFDWFTFLAARQPLEEVNFWQPSGGGAFRALDPGEPFFFRLNDRGYVTVTPEHRFEVSRRLREEFENGKTYYALEGRVIQLPNRAGDRPDPALLRWHNEQVFERGAA